MSRTDESPLKAGGQPAAADLEARSSGTQAIERSLGVLSCFLQAKPELGVTEIARALDLSPSTVHRIVRALVAARFLDQNQRTNRYHLGRATLLLGQVAQHNFGLDRLLPVAERLAETTGESVNVGLPDGMQAIVALSVRSQHALRFEQPPGTRAALHCSAMGKALLAFSRDVDRQITALSPLAALTPNTITRPEHLRRELQQVRERGFSFDDEESIAGVRCLGAPILADDRRPRAALALQAPSVRLPRERIPELVPPLLDAADAMREALPLDRLTGMAADS